ncbi:hypothetical protein [Paraflavitalea speifideaquila]|uniref:hypothetical protein n=1 Tax=Paraflavitalea speifideaquila TaxID=3076558 RepID=UPI0028E9EFBC|nr:hypothetical protein [Paraflavitalea speifideiaquila]
MTYQNMLMQVIYTPAAIFCLIAMVICLLTGSLLLIIPSPASNNKAHRLLGAAFLCFGITLLVIFLLFTRLLWFNNLGNIGWLLYIPPRQACYWLLSLYTLTHKYGLALKRGKRLLPLTPITRPLSPSAIVHN